MKALARRIGVLWGLKKLSRWSMTQLHHSDHKLLISISKQRRDSLQILSETIF